MSNSRFSVASAASAALVGLLSLACSAPDAHAQLLAYEGFQYTGTSLDTANGGSGWDVYNWADPDADAPLSDDNASLAFPGSVSFVPAGKRISFPFSGEVERRLGTPMNLATEASTFYFSALVKRTGDFRIEFQDNSNNARWRFGANGMTDLATNAVVGVASDATGPGLFPPEETVFIISKMRTRAASTNNDEVFLNIYRVGDIVPSQEPAVWHLSSAGASGVTLTRLIIRNISDTPLEVDELRLGTNYLDVAGANTAGAPVFARQPAAQATLYEGNDAQFMVEVAGTTPFTFQWYKSGQAIAGATSAVLTLTNLVPSQSGAYTVKATNPAGTTESAAAQLTVLPIDDITIGLQAMWKFDETTGLVAKDSTANQNDGALNNFPGDDTQWVLSEHNRALMFSGNNYVEMPHTPSIGANLLNRFSVAGWFRSNVPLTANGNTYRMLEKENSFFLLQGDGNAGGIGNGAFSLLVKKGGANISIGIGQALEANRWYHIASTFDGSNIRIYLDGELRGTRAVAAPIDAGGDMPLRIGSDYHTSAAKYFNGAIDELGFWSRALNSAEILNLAERSGPPTITVQPQSRSSYAGSTVSFTVGARGLNPLRYLWYFGTNEIRTANGPTLMLTGIRPENAGEYKCLVSNDAGEAFSAAATLTVLPVAGLSTASEAMWNLDETTGLAAADSSGKGRDGELRDYFDNTAQWGAGKVGGALSFDGVGNRVVVTNTGAMTLGTDVTFALWMRPENYGTLDTSPGNYTRNLGRLFNKGSNFDIYVIDDPGSVRATIIANGVNAPQNTVELQAWQHWAIVFSGGTVSFYKNGFRVGDPVPGAIGAASANPLVIGSNLADPTGTPWLYTGQMDQVGIWSRALSETEIMSLATRDIAGQPVIVNAPQSAERFAGASVSFLVDATGQRPVSYQWFHNATALPDSDTNRLALADLTLADAGSYTVTVQNGLGSAATTAPAVLTILQITNVTTGLVGYWPMDETSGTVLRDNSGRNHHAELSGGQTVTGGPGVIGGSSFFDGADDFAVVPHASDLDFADQASISAWVNPVSLGASTAGGLGRILRKDINLDVTLYANTSTLRMYGLNKVVLDAPANSFTVNEWQHLALVAKNGTIEFFRNGRSLGTPIPGFLGPTVTNDLVIGNYGPNLDIARLYNGNMDDLGLWKRALSASEIDGIYQNGLLGKPLSAPFQPLQVQALGFPSADQVQITFFSPYLNRQHSIQVCEQLETGAWVSLEGVTFGGPGNGITNAIFARGQNAAAYYRVALLPHPPVYSEDFESGAAGWTHGGSGDNWELGTPVNGPRRANSGTRVYATSLTGNLEPYTDSWLHSPVIPLTGLTRATLSFMEWRNVDPDPTFHGTVVNVLDASTLAVLQTLSTQAGGTTGYEPRVLPLPAQVLGRNVILEFRVYCDNFDLLEGWYIDDVKILPE